MPQINHELLAQHIAAFRANSTETTNGDIVERTKVSGSVVSRMYEDHGINADTLKQLSTAADVIGGAAVTVASESLAEAIMKAKADGIDPSGMKSVVSYTDPAANGSRRTVTVSAQRVVTNPQDRSQEKIIHGGVAISCKAFGGDSYTRDSVVASKERITALFG